MVRRVAGLVVPALLAACNAVFGLDETHAIDAALDAPPPEIDEDLDGIKNVEDNCPGIANGNQDNADGDGAGDDCDEHPMTAGDKIKRAYFFNDPSADPAEWTGAGWQFGAGHVAKTVLDIDGTLTAIHQPSGTSIAVEVGLEVTRWVSGSNEVGVLVEGAGGAKCFIEENNQGDAQSFLALESGSRPLVTTPLQPEITPGATLRLRASIDRTTDVVKCRLGSRVLQDTLSTPPDAIALFTHNSNMNVAYVVVYGTD